MFFTISNQTKDDIRCAFGKNIKNQHVLLVPSFSKSVEFSPRCTSLFFSLRSKHDTPGEFTSTTQNTSSVAIRLSMSSRQRWKRVEVQGDSSWVIYRNKISPKHHVLVVFPYRDPSCFLASIPDSVPLSSLMLPGTHETMAFYGWPISQCHTKPLDTQLHSGIRVLDLRLGIKDGRLLAYHGIFPEFTPFATMLNTLHNFLTSSVTESETVVVSIKQEDSDTTVFPKLVREEILSSPGGLEMWFLENRVPTLGEVRGKAVMFSRFGPGGDETGWEKDHIGIHPPIWPDSEKSGFHWECDRTLVRTHDWYAIPSFLSIPEKTSLSTEILLAPTDSPVPTLSISFMSASSVPFALPPIIARGFGWPKWGLGFEGVNDRVGKWLLDQLCPNDDNNRHLSNSSSSDSEPLKPPHTAAHESLPASCDDSGPRIRGWAMLDFYEDPIDPGVVPLFVECNFRGRRAGEEGW